jgi:hypothetical protein
VQLNPFNGGRARKPCRKLFETDGDLFVPTRLGRGYWQPGTLSGAAMASLLGFVIERDVMEPGLIPVRFGVDMLRMAPAQPLGVDLRVLHDGGRLKLVEASLSADGKLRPRHLPARPAIAAAGQSGLAKPAVARAAAGRVGAAAPFRQLGGAPRARGDAPPLPARKPTRSAAPEQGNPTVLGAMGPPHARQAWLRAGVEIVAGHPLTPFGHVALTADFASLAGAQQRTRHRFRQYRLHRASAPPAGGRMAGL